MDDHYDFSSGVQGKYYRPLEELEIPVYLGPDLRGKLAHIPKSRERISAP
jgi:hypothetical protein